jgi:hypothetical protein
MLFLAPLMSAFAREREGSYLACVSQKVMGRSRRQLDFSRDWRAGLVLSPHSLDDAIIQGAFSTVQL